MKKFKFLVAYGLRKRVFRKAFLISNIVIGLLVVIIANIPAIINYFAKDEEAPHYDVLIYNETTDQVQDTTGNLVDDLNNYLNLPFGDEPMFTVLSTDQMDLDDFWANNDYDILIHFTGLMTSPQVDMYSKSPEVNTTIMSYIQLLINEYQIDNYMPPSFVFHFPPDYEDPDQAMMVSSIASLLILPMFLLITMATQFIGVDIIEEKSTKAIETIIASVPAKIHFLSKIISSIVFIVIQALLLLLYGYLATLLTGAINMMSVVSDIGDQASLLNMLAELIPNWRIILFFSLLFMFIGTVFYLVIAALFASMATTQEDYQQFQAPLMLMLVGGFYIGIFAPMIGSDGFMKVMAFIPIFTPMVAPIAYTSGILSVLEVLIALGIVIVFTVLALYIVAPVYRVSILSYDQTKFFKRVKSSFVKAFQKNGTKK